MRQWFLILLYTASFCFCFSVHADSIELDGTTIDNVFITENDFYYIICYPEDGTTKSVEKKLVPESIHRSPDSRELQKQWLASKTERKRQEAKAEEIRAKNAADARAAAAQQDEDRRKSQELERQQQEDEEQERRSHQANIKARQQEYREKEEQRTRNTDNQTMNGGISRGFTITLCIIIAIVVLIVGVAVSGTNQGGSSMRSQLTSCKACGQSVSKDAPTCPHCGHPLKDAVMHQSLSDIILTIIGLIIFGLVLLYLGA